MLFGLFVAFDILLYWTFYYIGHFVILTFCYIGHFEILGFFIFGCFVIGHFVCGGFVSTPSKISNLIQLLVFVISQSSKTFSVDFFEFY